MVAWGFWRVGVGPVVMSGVVAVVVTAKATARKARCVNVSNTSSLHVNANLHQKIFASSFHHSIRAAHAAMTSNLHTQ